MTADRPAENKPETPTWDYVGADDYPMDGGPPLPGCRYPEHPEGEPATWAQSAAILGICAMITLLLALLIVRLT